MIHAAHDGPKFMGGDQRGLEHQLDAARAAGVRHLVYVSIVGTRHVPGMPYYAAKARAEERVRSSGLSASIFRDIRSTQSLGSRPPLFDRNRRFSSKQS